MKDFLLRIRGHRHKEQQLPISQIISTGQKKVTDSKAKGIKEPFEQLEDNFTLKRQQLVFPVASN